MVYHRASNYYSEATHSGALFDYSTVPYPQAADFLQACIAACPDSYHAHLVLGNFCFGLAADIRGFGWADSVTQDRWIGAALTCETAAAQLKVMTLSPRSVAACVTVMQMAAHFKEPYWLRQLFEGEPPKTIAHDDIEEPSLMDAALAHLAEYGVRRLQPDQAPQAQPAWLAPRAEHEMDQGKDYWLLRALELRPGHQETLTAYAQYLQPRWGGGSYEDIDGPASVPLCETLTEPQRNAIRWVGLWDELSDFPESEETQAVQAHRQASKSFLQRDVRAQ
ncbi:DUF4034 domain-containing protein [Achromobacter xylosoxidans]|uniref:DUF4034 domain-containing protein n=1 Tax=Alcaligenes xylosoxydans xylosoxydans TaxID=85698 RepID=UPI001F132D67|nr:DUF4034 domain-containing protein [Achromobacter xylosoxidans]